MDLSRVGDILQRIRVVHRERFGIGTRRASYLPSTENASSALPGIAVPE
jgi:hypothetical protein